MSLDWNDLVDRRNKWVAHNFPNPKVPNPGESLMGLMEEAGELAHAHLKELQAIRGTPEEHQANARDALGDITVYLWGVVSYYDVDLSGLMYYGTLVGPAEDHLFRIGQSVGTLATCGKNRVNTRVGYLIAECEAYARARGWDYEAIVLETWEAVETRDWIAYPENGRPPNGGNGGDGWTKQELRSDPNWCDQCESVHEWQHNT